MGFNSAFKGLIQHLLLSLSVTDRPVHRTVTYWEWRYQMLY